MTKKLTAKTQKIKGSLPPTSKYFSDSFSYTPEEQEIISQKGILYGIYSLRDNTQYETDLVTKLVTDIIAQSYYQSENTSPIQSLENAMADVKEKVLKLKESKKEESTETSFNLTVAALWGNILYIVINGSGNVHVVREGNFKEIETIREGGFAVATGVVKKGDVVVLSSKEFSKKLPPKKLLKLNPSELKTLDPHESCLMIKFDRKETESEEGEVKNFGLQQKKPGTLKKGAQKIKSMFNKKERGSSKGITHIKIRREKIPRKKITYIGLGLACAALIGAVFWTVQKTTTSSSTEETSEQAEDDASAGQEEGHSLEIADTPGTQIFYDLKIIDSTLNPLHIETIEDTLYVSDTSGYLYTSSTERPSFERISETNYQNIREIESLDDGLYISSDAGLSIYNTVEATAESYDIPSVRVFFPYLNSIYQIEEDKLQKYTLNQQEDEVASALWIQREEVREAKDMAISISIYLLTKEGSITKYTSGTEEPFEITGLEKALVNPTKLKTKWDWENMYVLDQGTNRIVVIDKEGRFIREVVNSNWKDLKDFTLTLDESNLFILNGSEVHQFAL